MSEAARSMVHMDTYDVALGWAREVCLALPEAFEERAWVGVRWKIRAGTFAHVLEIVDGAPHAFSEHAATRGPATILTLHCSGDELGAVLDHPAFFGPVWGRTHVGVRMHEHDDWDELAELVTDSYRLRAPKKLARLLDG